jgi:ATP-dependent Lon protease
MPTKCASCSVGRAVHPEHAAEQNERVVRRNVHTPAGGDIMFVNRDPQTYGGQRSTDDEKTQVSGWGNVSLILTGQLGDA